MLRSTHNARGKLFRTTQMLSITCTAWANMIECSSDANAAALRHSLMPLALSALCPGQECVEIKTTGRKRMQRACFNADMCLFWTHSSTTASFCIAMPCSPKRFVLISPHVRVDLMDAMATNGWLNKVCSKTSKEPVFPAGDLNQHPPPLTCCAAAACRHCSAIAAHCAPPASGSPGQD